MTFFYEHACDPSFSHMSHGHITYCIPNNAQQTNVFATFFMVI
jgi:hypothetical protein